MFLATVHLQRDDTAAGIGTAGAQGGLEAFGQALLDVFAHLDAVYHHIDVVTFVLLQLGRGLGVVDLPVDAKAHIALGLEPARKARRTRPFLACQRAEDHQPGVFGQLQHAVHHLADGLGLQRQIVVGAEGVPARA